MKQPFYKHHPLMIAVLTFMFLIFGSPNSNAAKGDFWLEVNGTSFHGESDYHDGYERRYGELRDLVGHPGCCIANEDYTRLYVKEERRKNYNSANYGFGLKYGLAKYADAFVGFYDNSYDKTSFYGGVNIKRDFYPGGGKFRVAPGLKLGLTTGYEGTPDDDAAWGPGGTAPMAVPNIEVGYGSVYTNAGYIPAIGEQSTWVVMVQGGIRLDFLK